MLLLWVLSKAVSPMCKTRDWLMSIGFVRRSLFCLLISTFYFIICILPNEKFFAPEIGIISNTVTNLLNMHPKAVFSGKCQ